MSLSFEQKEKELADKQASLRDQIIKLQHQLEITESNLELLREMKPKPKPKEQTDEEIFNNIATKQLLEMPTISISEAFVEGMKALQQFTKDALVSWVRNHYPRLDFSEKSLGRPIRQLMETGELEVLKPNQGNKTQAVYGYKPKH